MKSLFPIFLMLLFCFACQDQGGMEPSDSEVPMVMAAATYDIRVVEDITYAQGLSHDSLNSSSSSSMDLKLDLFLPENEQSKRPAIVLIHGGGFIGGSRKQTQLVELAEHFVARGWVAISVDYRLRDNRGTVPQAWVDFGANNPDPALQAQFYAIYPAHRDAKAAVRWLYANASTYHIDTDYITVGGGSAGAIIATSIGINEGEDFTNELSSTEDPTLASTNLDQDSKVHTIIDLWGSKVALDGLSAVYGRDRFDATDAPILIIHGTDDPTVEFFNAEDLRDQYMLTGVPFELHPLEGKGHGPWTATIDGKTISELSFDFVVAQQELEVR